MQHHLSSSSNINIAKNNLILKELPIEGYERVIEVVREDVGLHAIIAIHNTKLGPALGGIRAYPYSSFDQALQDVLRLSKGMTYKSGVAQSGTGGGKSVIILKNNKLPKPESLLTAFADAINQLQGEYIGAEDVGMSVNDLAVVRKGTRFVVGLPHPLSSGDPSRFTAFGGLQGIRAVCQFLWGSPSVKGKTIAIQGIGSVGFKLADLLFWRGARLIVADVDEQAAERAAKEFGAQVVSTEEILEVECDILAPCALGAILNAHTISLLNCKAVAGLANNQLLLSEDGEALLKRNILYAPDFVINSGGLLNVCTEIEKDGYHPAVARDYVTRIYDVLLDIFNTAKEKKKSTNTVAEEIAEYNIANEIGTRKNPVVFHH